MQRLCQNPLTPTGQCRR